MNMKDLPNEPVMKDLIQTITTFNVQFLKPKDDRLPGRIVYKKVLLSILKLRGTN